MLRAFAITALLLSMSGVVPVRANAPTAQTFIVNEQTDIPDINPGDGICDALGAAGEQCTFRAAIEEANAQSGTRDAILLPSGTYTLNYTGASEDQARTGDLDIKDSVVIIGAGQASTTIDGNQSDRIFDVFCGSCTSTVDLYAVHLRNGSVSGYGGAMQINGGTVNIHDTLIDKNTATGGAFGGGIFNLGSLGLFNTIVTDNDAGSLGGGIYNWSGSVIILDSEISYNVSGSSGGGIYTSDAILIQNSSLLSNQAAATGGGIHATTNALVIIDRTMITGNRASSTSEGGGGIYNAGSLTVEDSTFVVNTAPNSSGGTGGALYNAVDGDANMINVTVSGNEAYAYAAGLYSSGKITVTNGTIFDNGHYNSYGGTNGVANASASTATTLENTIVANNAGANCYNVSSNGHNLEDANTCVGLDQSSDIHNGSPNLGPLADNGGPTTTHALNDGSDAIDNGGASACPPTDQRGNTRAIDGDFDGTVQCDIGAYEYGHAVFIPLVIRE
jgi:predicted outer membrane repeat protein